jgi:hypothetical protein
MKSRVPAGETGAIPGDGRGTRTFTTTPKTPGHNVTMNSGRRAVGESLARVGNIPGGQSAPSGNRPITASRPAMRPQPGVLANQAETSRDLERRLTKSPQPFTNEDGAATLPTGRLDMSTLGIPYNVMADVNAKPQSYGKHVGCGNTSEINSDAVGYSRAELMAARGYREQHGVAGRPGSARQAGMPGTKNANTTARANARMRQT